MVKERVTTTIELSLYNLATTNGIAFSDALALGIVMMNEKKSEIYSGLESRIDYLEDKLDKANETILEIYGELQNHDHDD